MRRHLAATSPWWTAGSTGPVRKVNRGGTGSKPPRLKGLQRSRRQPASSEPAEDAEAADRLRRVGGAGRLVAAAAGHRRRDPALIGADRHQRRAVSRRTLPGGDARRSAPPRCTRLTASVPPPLDQGADLRPGDEDEVVLGRQLLRQPPERLAQGPLDAVALDRAADLAADRDAEPDIGGVAVAGGGSCRGPGSGSRARFPRGRRGRSPRSATGAGASAPRRRPLPSLRGEALAALAAAALDDRPAAAGTHAGAEPVGPGPLALLGLVGALHRSVSRQYTDAPSGRPRGLSGRPFNLFFGICGRPDQACRSAALWSARLGDAAPCAAASARIEPSRRKGSARAGNPRSTESRRAERRRGSRGISGRSGRRLATACAPRSPSPPSASGWSRCARWASAGRPCNCRRPTGSGPGPSGATGA